jgi:hypothetical protein
MRLKEVALSADFGMDDRKRLNTICYPVNSCLIEALRCVRIEAMFSKLSIAMVGADIGSDVGLSLVSCSNLSSLRLCRARVRLHASDVGCFLSDSGRVMIEVGRVVEECGGLLGWDGGEVVAACRDLSRRRPVCQVELLRCKAKRKALVQASVWYMADAGDEDYNWLEGRIEFADGRRVTKRLLVSQSPIAYWAGEVDIASIRVLEGSCVFLSSSGKEVARMSL